MSVAAGSCARSSVPIPPTRRAPCTSRSSPGANRPAPAVRVGHPRPCPSSAGVELARVSSLLRTSAPCASCSANPASARAGSSTRRSPPWTAGRSGPPSASGWSPLCRMQSSRTWRPSCSRTMSRRGARPRPTWPAWPPRWAARCSARPTALVIDDLQWADEPSLAALGLVLRRRPRGLLVLAAAREAELDPDGAARQFVDLATGLGLADTVPLAALTPEEVVAGGFSFATWQRTGGHPLLFTECLRGGGEEDLAALVLARATEAGADAVELLRSAAVLDRAAPLADLARLAELSPVAGRAAAEQLVRQGLLAETGGLWHVRHDVFAELVQAALARRPGGRGTPGVGTAPRSTAPIQPSWPTTLLAAEAWEAGMRFSLAAGDRSLAAYANRRGGRSLREGAGARHGAQGGRGRGRSGAAQSGARRGSCAHRPRPDRGSPPPTR